MIRNVVTYYVERRVYPLSAKKNPSNPGRLPQLPPLLKKRGGEEGPAYFPAQTHPPQNLNARFLERFVAMGYEINSAYACEGRALLPGVP